MTDTLAIVTLASIGSSAWFGLQTLAWSICLGRFCGYNVAHRLLVAAIVTFPVFVLLLLSVRPLFGSPTSAGELILLPLVVAWVLFLSWGGLRVAARMRGMS